MQPAARVHHAHLDSLDRTTAGLAHLVPVVTLPMLTELSVCLAQLALRQFLLSIITTSSQCPRLLQPLALVNVELQDGVKNKKTKNKKPKKTKKKKKKKTKKKIKKTKTKNKTKNKTKKKKTKKNKHFDIIDRK